MRTDGSISPVILTLEHESARLLIMLIKYYDKYNSLNIVCKLCNELEIIKTRNKRNNIKNKLEKSKISLSKALNNISQLKQTNEQLYNKQIEAINNFNYLKNAKAVINNMVN